MSHPGGEPALARPALELRGVSVEFGSARVLDGVDLTLAEGETLALLGPSGSGKTTLMHAVAGFLPLAEGEVIIRGEVVATPGRHVPPDRRGVGMVFQNYALWPHMDSLDTVAYPLRRSGVARAEARAEAASLMNRLGIGDLGMRRPSELSGGEQQRVGLARAFARRAGVYLFDEPTAHLDAIVRMAVQEEIRRVRGDNSAATVHSTHDATEALALADRVALLREGRVIQVGAPAHVYERPVDRWAARLTGSASVLRALGDGHVVSVDGTPVPALNAEAANGQVDLLVRPEWIAPGGPLAGAVTEVYFRGSHTDYHVRTPVGDVMVRRPGVPAFETGSQGTWRVERGWVL